MPSERATAAPIPMPRWIESAGGPLVVVPAASRACWMGASSRDYGDACVVDEYLGLLSLDWGAVLVLGDEPLRTTVVPRPEGPAIVRWLHAPAAEELLALALSVRLDGLPAVERLIVRLRDEPYVISTVARRGRTPSRSTSRLRLRRGPSEPT